MLVSVLACEESFEAISRIEAPVGMLPDLLSELSDRPDLWSVCEEGSDCLLHVTAGGLRWHFGGIG